MTYEIIQPHRHHVHRAKIGHFDMKIDIKFKGGLSTIDISSKIDDVVFFSDRVQRVLDFNTVVLFYMGEDLIQNIVDLSIERLNELCAKVSE